MKRQAWFIVIGLALAGAVGWGALKGRLAPAKTSAAVPDAATPAVAVSRLELAPGDVARAAVVTLSRNVEASGSVKAVSSAMVKARVVGELRNLTVREGDTVRAGQVIGQIDTVESDLRLQQARQQANASRAQLDIAQRALKNNQALVNQGFISATALETSVANEAAAAANLSAANAAVSIANKSRSDATLKSPISGQVSQRLAQPGERVGIDARIVEVVDLSRMELEAAVPPTDAAELRVGQRASLRVEGIANPISATVARISPSAQAGSRAILVYLALEQNPALRHGLFARASVAVEQRRVLAVPATAVRRDQGQPTVPAVADGVVTNKAVTLGATGLANEQSMTEIRSGLVDGEQILMGSVGVVRDATRVALPRAAPPPAAATPGAASASAAR